MRCWLFVRLPAACGTAPAVARLPPSKPHLSPNPSHTLPLSSSAQVMRLIDNELSEPYSIFTYRHGLHVVCWADGHWPHARRGRRWRCQVFRQPQAATPLPPCLTLGCRRYFLHSWPHLCFLVYRGSHCFGTVVAKMEVHRGKRLRGYIAMLTVEKEFRYLGVGALLGGREGLVGLDGGDGWPFWGVDWGRQERIAGLLACVPSAPPPTPADAARLPPNTPALQAASWCSARLGPWWRTDARRWH